MAQIPTTCPCPGTPHPDGDTVTLRDKLGLKAGVMLQGSLIKANKDGVSDSEMTGLIVEAYVLHGVEAWTFVDAEGKPVPVSEATIRSLLLDDFSLSIAVSNAADDLYFGPMIVPLVLSGSISSPPSPTDESTSAATSKPSRKRSRRSSTTTTPTDAIATITPSPAGDSSSSPSSASAAA